MYIAREKEINLALRSYCLSQPFSYYMPNVVLAIIIDYTIEIEEWSEADELRIKIDQMLLVSIPQSQYKANEMFVRIEGIFSRLYKAKVYPVVSYHDHNQCWTDCSDLLRMVNWVKDCLSDLGRKRATWRRKKLNRHGELTEYLMVRRNRSIANHLYDRDMDVLKTIHEQIRFILNDLTNLERKL